MNCEFCGDYTTGTILIYGKGDISVCGKEQCIKQAKSSYGRKE